eukprot:m.210536 g.210536  ORF g.210536 m.210536 type:complete len:56 (-) comp33080_c0_seq4:2397-2564(-)
MTICIYYIIQSTIHRTVHVLCGVARAVTKATVSGWWSLIALFRNGVSTVGGIWLL